MTIPDALLQRPHIRLSGPVNDAMLQKFLVELDKALDTSGPIVLELTTSGGEADVGRRIAEDIRIQTERGGVEMLFLGKTAIFSAGVTIMSAFPCERRFLSKDGYLLIHERRLQKELHLSGALRSVEGVIRDLLAEINSGQRLERDGFENLVRGSKLEIEDLYQHVLKENWYLSAAEALKLKLVAGIL
ncbi:MAG: peptidase S14 [Comamonadaceae bacterium]|nr:MAG: peptidase S14 [Comamonadaceae bacterium]